MSISEAQSNFIKLIRGIKDEADKLTFLLWVQENWKLASLNCNSTADDEKIEILRSIACDLKAVLPITAVMESETITTPECGPYADCDADTTVHLDHFLYDDDEVDKLVESGLMSTHYCSDCKSRNVKELTLISHSMSIDRLHYIFRALVPDLDGKIVLDVGSRLGAVLYGAYMFSKAKKIIGIEMNKELSSLQDNIIQKYGLGDRISVIHRNVFDTLDVVATADVVVLNNVFSFFCDTATCVLAWQQLSQSIKKGAIIVTVPHLQVTFQHLGKELGFEWESWVKILAVGTEAENMSKWEEHLEDVMHYQVIAIPSISKPV